ncbi:hypothetical protein O6H91_01G156300 [Diphasiastrum complanatum]|uniref:Uncharacterized protein n=1 Tax=Diphasiastrum complanatum TaxID=34168 RepID=A0ACC2EXN7_DIPCM|nr:hypothetical protein O6H91_01G156300 [Diphasiastrum complanatum]
MINRFLADFLEIKVPASKTPSNGVASKNVTVDSSTGVWARIFYPCSEGEVYTKNPDATKKKLPVVIYVHGGGFTFLCPNFLLYDKFCRTLARDMPCIVISVHYRRSPEHRYPTAYDDSYAALKWLQSTDQLHDLPCTADLSRCVLMGDSAGGNIVHHIGCKAATEDLKPLSIRGHVLIQPFFGGQERTPSEILLINAPIVSVEQADWHWKAYLPPDADRDHPASNIFGPHAADISGISLPPTLVTVGELDMLQDWQLRYVKGLQKAGKKVGMLFYEGGIHCFHLLLHDNLAKQFRLDVFNFIQEHCQCD